LTGNYWRIKTRGDPLGTVHQSVHKIWERTNMSMMLLTVNGTANKIPEPRIIKKPECLKEFNPFKPVMSSNLAKLIPGFISDHRKEKIGAMLRPCEMRTLVEMQKLNGFSLDNLITISFDCLGTLPTEDYLWRAKKTAHPDQLSQEALQFARQGGILAYRNRAACQICASPQAEHADININVLGLPIRHYILVSSPDVQTAQQLNIDHIVDSEANPSQVSQHIKLTAKLSERNQQTFERLVNGLEGILPKDIESLISQFNECGSCQSCMEICPICDVFRPSKDAGGKFDRTQILRWLTACSGCGICEPLCPKHLPLNTIFQYIRNELIDEVLH